MNKYHWRKVYIVMAFAIGLTLTGGLVLYALNQNLNVFVTPSNLVHKKTSTTAFRLGGMVKQHSLIRNPNTLAVQFTVTDLKHEVTVNYTGVLPDLFREGKGVVADGYLNKDGIFMANMILAKHDENYMPQKIQQTLAKEQLT
ncbi:MAG: cytochrome c maturation protein CcmE [Gammaproteobacteria bacterium]|nr:cytochrome c maturation protein CcmE [Gammaproteobacteria bacterium]